MNILIVDDESDVCDAIETSLSIAEMQTYSVQKKLHFHQLDFSVFDCILIDFYLGDWDGLQVVQALNQHNYNGGVVLVTSMSDAVIKVFEDAVFAAGLNYWGTLPKPIRQADLFVQLSLGSQRHVHPAPYMPKPLLQEMLEKDTLVIEFQPQVDLQSGAIIGFEALSRLRLDDGHNIAPPVFLPLLERYELTEQFNRMLIRKGLQQIAQSPFTDVQLSFNFSVDHLHPAFAELLMLETAKAGFPLTQLTVEITEDKLLNAGCEAIKALNTLTYHGVKVSLDDFGSGFNAFRQLAEFDFSEIKLDKYYTQTCGVNKRSEAILDTAVELANKLSLVLIVEGVETVEQQHFLSHKGVQIGQGFYFGRPAPLDSFIPK